MGKLIDINNSSFSEGGKWFLHSPAT